MRVFVAGGTGAIGRRLVPQLLLRGHEVIATTQAGRGAARLQDIGAEPAVVDGLDRDAVRAAVMRARPDAIVHEMTALGGKPDLRHFDRWFAVTNRLRTEGTKHLLAAAEAAHVRRFVAQSYTGWNNEHSGGRLKTEADPLDQLPAKSQTESMAAIRFLEQAVGEAELEGIVLRYGSLYGPGSSEGMVELVRKRSWPVVGSGAGVWSWIHLDDVSSATIAALERGAPGVYNVVDDQPLTHRDFVDSLAEALGAHHPRFLPMWLTKLAGGPLRTYARSMRLSNRKLANASGWSPTFRSVHDGWPTAVAPFRRAPREELRHIPG